ncbi:hypothetical protein BE61_48680 [Bradyrhizobium elkanii USDA 61]|nr:hypothetical protein BE61_48680 [Bradyrhizobium elkanii USDA 61]
MDKEHPVAWRWRTLPQFSEEPEDQEWALSPTKPIFLNPHHHEVDPLYSEKEHPDGPWVNISALSNGERA